jgi:predicted dehydrogenase
MKRIRIGIIGCGEVTQINHLPSLKFLEDQFEVTAVSDVSASVLEAVGNLHHVSHRFLDYRDLLKSSQVDAVLITTPHAYHAPQTLAALEHGKHVLVEKPMAMTLEDADAVIAAQKRTGLIVQVGYMRRYASAFEEAVTRVKKLESIRLARVHAVIGRNEFFSSSNSKVIRGSDVPAQVIEAGKQLHQRKMHQAIGEASRALTTVYELMVGLCTHDLSAMRELIGIPKKVLYATQRQGGLYISAAFDYGEFVCHFETTIDQIPRFDSHLEVFGNTQVLKVQYDTPYVRHLATKLEIISATPDNGVHLETIQPAFEDNFTREWRAFHRNVSTGSAPKTNPEDYRHDLELFAQMIKCIRETDVAREPIAAA